MGMYNRISRSWFFVFFMRSISRRRARVVIASISIALAVALITCMIGITKGINEKLGSELRAYGANILVLPEEGDYLNSDIVDRVLRINHVISASGQVLGRTFINRQAIEMIGLDVNDLKAKGWRLFGDLPSQRHELLAGVILRDILGLEKGSSILLEGKGRKIEFIVTGFIERGGPEDRSVIMSIQDAWELIGQRDILSAILVRGKAGRLDGIVEEIRKTIPEVTAKTIRQVAFAEVRLLSKIQLLLILATIVVLSATCISVASTMGANVLERREEIGLMKAIGATRREISSFYIAEAVLIGLLGGLAGFIVGYLFAEVVSWGAFKSLIKIPLYLPFVSITTGMMVSLISTYIPVRDAMRYSAAVILREE